MSNFMSFLHRRPDSGWIMKAGRIHKYEETIPFLRQANKGARVSVFKEGKYKYAYKIDLNSAYWKEMTEMPFPDLLKERVIEAETLEALGYEAITKKEGVVELTINVPDIRLGVLATRIGTEKEYSLEFPNKKCQIRGTWSIYEINYALTKGYEIVQLTSKSDTL